MTRISLAAVASYLPKRWMTAAEISAATDIPEDVVVEKFGLRGKHIAAPDEHVSDMAVTVGERLLEQSGFERADVDAVVEMLAADGAMTMPPLSTWYRGREAVAAFLEAEVLSTDKRWRLVPARANGQPAFGNYRWDEERETFRPRSISVLTLGRGGIAEITTFLGPELIPRFGLPDEL